MVVSQVKDEQMRAYPAQPQPQLSLLVKPPVARPGWQPRQVKAGSEKYREHYNLPKQPDAAPVAEPLFSPGATLRTLLCAHSCSSRWFGRRELLCCVHTAAATRNFVRRAARATGTSSPGSTHDLNCYCLPWWLQWQSS